MSWNRHEIHRAAAEIENFDLRWPILKFEVGLHARQIGFHQSGFRSIGELRVACGVIAVMMRVHHH